jgi:hypothetical protein
MSAPSPISLRFGAGVENQVRSRIGYAFRVFAAIYNYRVVEADSSEAAIWCLYGEVPPQERSSRHFHIPSRYQLRPLNSGAQSLVRHRYAGEEFHLFLGIDKATGTPDWLGEIFTWISSSHELSITGRDSVGRIPYHQMIFSKNGISPRKPYAILLMAWLDNSLRNGQTLEALPKAPSPVPGVEHFVVCSHDIDFYYTTRSSALIRLLKNLGISFRLYRSWSYFSSNSRMILQLLGGKRVGDYLPSLLATMQRCDVQSTLFVVPQRGHRRDPDYQLGDLVSHLSEASSKGFSVGVHGSYNSIIEARTLTPEVAALEKVLGRRPLGSRQHWLRFDRHEKLFEAVEDAELLFDSTLGFAEVAGFRNGASFAFPPYDFEKEKPHEFLEIPLVLMDGNLEAASRTLGENPQVIADEVLGQSRKWSWGGIAALWHNPMEPLSVPKEINRVFWNCAKNGQEHAEKWVSAEKFLAQCLGRYQDAGLMKGARIHA